jgi:hypothetical protein
MIYGDLKRFFAFFIYIPIFHLTSPSVSAAVKVEKIILPRRLAEVIVPDHDGGWPEQINAWFLYTHMVYL